MKPSEMYSQPSTSSLNSTSDSERSGDNAHNSDMDESFLETDEVVQSECTNSACTTSHSGIADSSDEGNACGTSDNVVSEHVAEIVGDELGTESGITGPSTQNQPVDNCHVASDMTGPKSVQNPLVSAGLVPSHLADIFCANCEDQNRPKRRRITNARVLTENEYYMLKAKELKETLEQEAKERRKRERENRKKENEEKKKQKAEEIAKKKGKGKQKKKEQQETND